MRLMHPRLPWYVDVKPGPKTPGVSIFDVLHALYEELDRPIAARDFWNVELNNSDRKSLTRAFKERCLRHGQYAGEEMAKGVKRIDFLGAEFVFVGLSRRNGMWELRTMSEYAH
ncbi:hypothetical protein GGX14DRAFT_372244 [Mycena pura]|uniref:DUF6699 domain-containing protein n=1 Tax=Mycena pura TaxID=153505 RepID=A0AAD6YB87_9AGAR|nr:hypothetical protein GGX14DRAFT_372244 [Mycena pura]